MSTKTTFKRVALVTVAALGFGLLSSVVPAQAVTSTGLVASVGPNGATSLTVVGGDSTTAGALVRLDVTGSDTSALGALGSGESITATVVGVPTGVTAKTLAANGGSMADTTTVVGTRSDFTMLETYGQSAGVPSTTAALTTTGQTNWSLLASSAVGSSTRLDSGSVGGVALSTYAVDGVVGQGNTGFLNMDGSHQLLTAETMRSYYVTIRPRTNSVVMDQGAYTFQFQLTDINGVVRATKTVKIDFVTTAAKSDATVTLTPVGTFLKGAALNSYDSATADAYASITLRNRDGGLVRTHAGTAPVILATVQLSTTAAPNWVDTMTSGTMLTNDSGTYGSDFGTNSITAPGTGTNQTQDGIYGVKWAAADAPGDASSTTTGAVVSYRWQIGYGNATLLTPALTVYPASGAGTATAANTDYLVTATGMSAADKLVKTGITNTWTLPTTTTTASVKFAIQTSSDTATPGAAITVTPTWSGAYGTSAVTPADSTTGTIYTTDSNGNFTVSVANTAPVAGATLTLVATGPAAFGAGKATVVITWAKPAASSIAIADPINGVYVKTGSTNVTTVIVKDQFGTPVAGDVVTVALSALSANYSATTSIAPITTGAAGTATYSLVGGATTATYDAITFKSVVAGGAGVTMTYNYLATLPVVATLTAYHGLSWDAAATLTPATGIYATGTTELLIKQNRDLTIASGALTDGATTNDAVALRFTALTSAGVTATGALVTVTAGAGGHIVSPASGLPVKTYNYNIGATGTAVINVLATGTGDVVFTATTGTLSTSATLKVANATADARFVTISSAATGTSNGSGVPVTVTVTDRNGNVVSGVDVNVVASGVGSFMGGAITSSFKTDSSGTYTFLANSMVSEGGVAKFTATSGTSADFTSAAGYVATTVVDSTLAAGNSSASLSITFAAGASASDVAQTATDAAAEATDAANAATDAANAAAEAADAATAAAQDAADAVAALSAQVATLISGLKAQLTALTNLVIKIQKKVKA